MTTQIVPTMAARLFSEALGTFILVFGGVGTAVLAGSHVGFHGIAIAFGLTVVVGAYAFGPISGGHFNPAVTLGLATAGRFAWRDVPAYVVSQIIGGLLASTLLYLIATGREGADLGNFASNGYGEASPRWLRLGSGDPRGGHPHGGVFIHHYRHDVFSGNGQLRTVGDRAVVGLDPPDIDTRLQHLG